jgi:transposase-like protein
MNLIEQIEHHKYLYLTEIGEPDINVLRIVIEEAKASGETRDVKVDSTKISDCRPIISDETCQKYEIVFGSYVAYCVRNESYTVMDESEKFTGRLFNIYSKSHFLDYVRAATIASEEYPGKFVHYGINCLDHIVDVVSVDEPEIRMLRRA